MCQTILTKHSCKHFSSELLRCSKNTEAPRQIPRECPSGRHWTTTLRSEDSCSTCNGASRNTPLLVADRNISEEGGLAVKAKCIGCEVLGNRAGDEWWVADIEECIGEDTTLTVVAPAKKIKLDSGIGGMGGDIAQMGGMSSREVSVVKGSVAGVVVWGAVEWTDEESGGSEGTSSDTASSKRTTLTTVTPAEEELEKEISPRTTSFGDWMQWGKD